MRKSLLALSMLAISAGMMAVPAKRGVWRTVKLADGTEVKVELRGDEHASFWQAENGMMYVQDGMKETFRLTDANEIADMRANSKTARALMRNMDAKKAQAHKAYSGKKRGLLILANFSDKKFASTHTKEIYKRICNEEGFTHSWGFKGSVRDYFTAQSHGLFEPTFDVVGPVELSGTVAYYGQNQGKNTDIRSGSMIAEACKLANAEVNFADYDWNDDGEVDLVFVLYAGRGESNCNDPNTIWPHKGSINYSDYGRLLSLDGVLINTYACSSEMTQKSNGMPGDRIAGIGTICHEFSHCLGLADMYDTTYGGNFGLGMWSLMASGGYSGSEFTPTGYNAFEKYSLGWAEPTILNEPATVKGMRPVSEEGQTFIIYNDNHKDEYFLLENRNKTNWDVSLPGAGLLILHVDYNSRIWDANMVNSTGSNGFASNDHQRCTIFHADNTAEETSASMATDPYPYMVKNAQGVFEVRNNALTDQSSPAATLFNPNSNGTMLMGKTITNITRNEDGTISFDFMGGSETNIIDGIENTITGNCKKTGNNKIYTIDGRIAGSNLHNLEKGLYIMNGKKIVR